MLLRFPDGVDSSGEVTDADIQGDLEILNKDDSLTPIDEGEKVDEIKPDDTTPLVPDKEKDEPAGLPAAIKTKYPEIFKEFPDLRKAIFHEKEFLKIFGTVDEAKDAAQKAENMDYLISEIESGNLKPLIEGLKETNEQLLKTFASKVLPAIYTESKDLYFQIIDPILINVLKTVQQEGESTGNDNLKFSAQHVAKLLFGKIDVLEGKTTETKTDPEREAFEAEKRKFMTERFNEARASVNNDITSGLNKIINEGLDNLNISGYLKKVIVKEVQTEVDVMLTQDTGHMSQMSSLWKKAANAGYPSEWLARITSTYLARAKPLVPSVRSKIKAELVKSKVVTPAEKLPTSGGTPGAKPSGPVDSRKVDWNKTSDEQFLAGNITYKK